MEKILREKLPGGKFKNVSSQHRKIMQSVRGRGNLTTEARLRGGLVKAGVKGWRIHNKQLKGAPDFYFHKEKIAIFVDGCFWHGCPICGHVPKKNLSFWKLKITRNKVRDNATNKFLRNHGAAVIRFWEHELANSLSRCVGKVIRTQKVKQSISNFIK
jgi:DNA mismatch endonuclease (patch repair protein)